MLYVTAGDLRIVVLELANLQEIQKGRPAVTPDKTTLIAFTPDPVWLADKLQDAQAAGDMTLATFMRLVDEAAKRPQKPVERPYHDTKEVFRRAGT